MLLAVILQSFPFKFLFSFTSSIAISVRGYRRKSLNFSGAAAAIVVGFVLTLASYSFFAILLMFFVSSSFWTKWKSEKKKKIEEGFKEGGQRNWIQVMCNGGFPVAMSIFYLIEVGYKERPINYARDFTQSALSMAVIGAIACCNGDTWSSEIGTAIGPKTPRLITTLKKVPVGTNGAISFVGTFASIIGGLLIGLVYHSSMIGLGFIDSFHGEHVSQWPIILLGALAGFIGSVIDSLLGATMQYSGFCESQKKVVSKPSSSVKHISGKNVLDNHLVNLISSSITGLLTSYLGYVVWQYVD